VHSTLGPRRVHDPDDESTMILFIISNYLPDNMAQNPKGYNLLIARLYAPNRKPVKLEKY
jgi:hypothetical protein